MPSTRGNGLERWRGEVSEALRDIGRRLDEQKAAIDTFGSRFAAALEKHADDDVKVADELNTRVATVERSQANMRGRLAVGAAVIGAVAGALADALLPKLWR